MKTYRRTAIIVGVLYIIGTVAGILSVVFSTPILDGPDFLIKVSANENQFVIAALLVLLMGLALAMVPVMMFSILKEHNQALALGYVVFRGALETVTYIGGAISRQLLLPLSEAYVQAGPPDVSIFQPLGTLLMRAAEFSANTTEIVFPVGALMFYCLLYRSRLIPRWISGWGLIGAIPYLAAGLLHLFGLISAWSTIQMVLVLPLAVQEMVMAVWLLVKGFNQSAIASLSAKTELNEIK